jgi:hypothetical protein
MTEFEVSPCSFVEKTISLQKSIILSAYHGHRWWYSRLLETYKSILQQALLFIPGNSRIGENFSSMS